MRLLAFFALLVISFCVHAQALLFVNVHGNDLGSGTKKDPFATLQTALKKAREFRRLNDTATKKGINIFLGEGKYSISETIVLRPEDAGTNESPTIIQSINNKAILSGGVEIKGWKKLTTSIKGINKNLQNNIWVADVPEMNGNDFNFRQLWVNDVKAVRAKSSNGDTMQRIFSWNKKNATCIIPTQRFEGLQNEQGVEFFIHQWWEIAVLRIKKIEVKGDSTTLYFHQPESKIQNEHPWPAPWISKETGNSAFYLTNAIQFLDEPGEWYLDLKNHKLYYYPRSNEDMQTATVIAPFAETLIDVRGTREDAVSNIIFKNIGFEHCGWLRPSQQGHVPHQVGLFMTEAYKLKPAGTKEKPMLDNQAFVGRQAAAVEINFAKNISFENCSFQHIASTAIDCKIGVKETDIKGNLFKDIGGNAILGGNYGDEGREIHLVYNPKNEIDVCDGIKVENNFITDVTNEDWGTVGIGFGFVSNTTISHNEIENISYSGISLGWGWNTLPNIAKNNKVVANWIHHYGKHNYDCAGIYTLSNQLNSFVEENSIDSIYKAPYAHLPSHWFYLYTDEGSSNFTIKNNWTPSTKYLQNSNGPNNVWENNGPQVNADIKQKAGLLLAYQYLRKENTRHSVSLPINEEHKEMIELVVKEGKQLDLSKLKNLLVQLKMDSNAIYQWQNHFVVFDKVQDIGVMQGKLQSNFPEADVKIYHDLFYEFSKKKHCSDTTTAREWQHIILTVNLVADEKKQKEYLNAHATQFEKLPQIAQGFCNANFQQLLVFRNGRQLMLVISIPKGESLDKLNPKTTENNPTMIEWNKKMANYQEGIKGTKPNETWVFFKPLTPKGE